MACRHGPDPNSLFESAPGEFTLEETGDENVGLETDVRSNMLKDLMANRARLRLACGFKLWQVIYLRRLR